MGKKHPMQKIVLDSKGVPRFQQNDLVRYLLDAGPFDLNHLAILPNISKADREQFAQLIGYSVSGFGGLDYARKKTVRKADNRADKLMAKTAPRFAHSCNDCVFLGHHEEHDLYACPKNGPERTVVARYGSAGSHYTSGIALKDMDPVLGEAHKRAVERGLIDA